MMGGSLNQNFCAILRLFFAFLNSDDASGKIVSFAMILFFQIRVFLVEFFKKDKVVDMFLCAAPPTNNRHTNRKIHTCPGFFYRE